MTMRTEVRVNWPVPALALLDAVTVAAGGDPATVHRKVLAEGALLDVAVDHVMNVPDQGLDTLASVRWQEQPDEGEDELPAPPALVILVIDNVLGDGYDGRSAEQIQAEQILPAVVAWLDDLGVPRDRWWWEDEYRGTYHPGTEPVAKLVFDDKRDRVTWEAR